MEAFLRPAIPLIRQQCRHSSRARLISLHYFLTDPRPAYQFRRALTSSAQLNAAPKTKDRGPASKEDTQTDFGEMNVLGSMPVPTSAVDSCMEDGFAFNSGLRIKGAGALLAAGEAFAWRPWLTASPSVRTQLVNSKGQFDIGQEAWGLLDLMWPKPDILVIGTGSSITPLSVADRQRLSNLGIRVEVQDTRNAAAQFNLLATERGSQQVAAALIPIGWHNGKSQAAFELGS